MPPFVLAILKFTLLALLYVFVYRMVRAIILDLRGGRPPAPARSARARRGGPAKVLVHGGGKSSTHRLSGTLQIGRGVGCQIRLEDTYVSQLHAKISDRNGSWVVEDLGSTNGTFLNERKVTVPTEIGPGDRIRVGRTTLEIRK